MSDTFLSTADAALWCNLQTTTVFQDAVLDQLCLWADAIIIDLTNGNDPRTNPEYEGDTFGGLSYVASQLVVREYRKIINESHGIDQATFNATTVTNSKAPDISPMMEMILQRYRFHPIV